MTGQLLMSCLLLAPAAAPRATAEPRVIFAEPFEGKLSGGWTWLRENPKTWRLKDGALEIRVQPGRAEDSRNVLVRSAPDRRTGKFALEASVTFLTPPSNQFEQAGITWYHQSKPGPKLVHERIDGKTYIIPGRVPTNGKMVQLRLVVTDKTFVAQFRPEAKGEFKTVGTGPLPEPGDDRVSLQCYNGPADAEHWIRFDDFRILELHE